MKKKRLDEHIRHHYDSTLLDPNKLRDIMAVAAVALLACVLMGTGGWVWQQNAWRKRAFRAAAMEVALNHRKDLQDYQTVVNGTP